MPNSFRFLLLFLVSMPVFSQTVTIRGKVLEEKTQLPLESATVYLTRVADTSVVDYTITEKNGSFSLKTPKSKKAMLLKVSFVGYKTFLKELPSLENDQDFGTLQLTENDNTLQEVVLKNEVPPVRVKNDTLEFNASSFKLRPDANVETLLKQLPGVEIDADGKITVNGKEVNQILVNGKPFFDKDGKVALQNLPSDIINKVQVTDSKTKAEEISGKAARSDAASINLTIDEDKNKGLFGKATAGYGSDSRYESSLLLNYFKDTQKISILGSANNINSTGFTMNEIFDSMGGGRNYSIWTNDDGSFGINGMMFGGGRGITRSNMFGANYADQWFKDFDVNGSYFYIDANTKNNNRTKQVNLLPDGDFTTTSNSFSENAKFAHNYNFAVEYKIDSTATISFNPKVVRSHSSNKNRFAQESTDENGQLLNESSGNTLSDADKNSVENNFYFFKAMKRKGRSIGITFDNENAREDSFDLNRSFTTLYDDTDNDGVPDTATDDNRDQVRRQRAVTDNYFFQAEYVEPVTDSLNLALVMQYSNRRQTDYRNTFAFDGDDYTVYKDSLSSFTTSHQEWWAGGVGLTVQRSKFSGDLYFYTKMADFRNRSLYLGNEVTLNKNYLLPEINGYVSYRFTKSKSLWLSYNYNVEFPQPDQILPVENFFNPLITFKGNPDLDLEQRHYMYFNFRDYDFATKSGYTIYAGGNYYTNQVVSATSFDASRKRLITYRNIADTYNSWFGGNWSKSFKKEAHSFKYSFGINAGLSRNKGFVNGEGYAARALRMTPRVNFTYDYGELLSINPSYNYTYNVTYYENYNVEKQSNVVHEFKLQTTSYWPKHVVFGNDVSYRYNSNIADGFKKDFYLWNISLGYNFLSDKLLAKVKVYDLLNQNQSATRTISATSVRDEMNDVLQRYVMFSLTYKLEKFGGKKKEGSHFWWQD